MTTTVVPAPTGSRRRGRRRRAGRGGRDRPSARRGRRTSGRPTSAAASARRWCCPPESRRTVVRANPSTPSRWASSSTGAGSAYRPARCRSSRKGAVPVGRPPDCSMTPTRARVLGPACQGSAPSTVTEPASGRCRPTAHSTAVVLPAPFGPSTVVTAPPGADHDIASQAVKPVKRRTSPSRRTVLSKAVTRRECRSSVFVAAVYAGPLGFGVQLGPRSVERVDRWRRTTTAHRTTSRGGAGTRGCSTPCIAHHSRLLDPTKATKLGDEVFDTTLYVADRVLVRGTPVDNGGLDTFQKWCAERGYTLTPDPGAARALRPGAAVPRRRVARRLVGDPRPDRPRSRRALAVDAWALIQERRASRDAQDTRAQGLVGLDHLDVRQRRRGPRR